MKNAKVVINWRLVATRNRIISSVLNFSMSNSSKVSFSVKFVSFLCNQKCWLVSLVTYLSSFDSWLFSIWSSMIAGGIIYPKLNPSINPEMPIEVPRDISSDLLQRFANWPAYVIDTDRGIWVRTCPNMSNPNKFLSSAIFFKIHPISKNIFVDKTTVLIVKTLVEIHSLWLID